MDFRWIFLRDKILNAMAKKKRVGRGKQQRKNKAANKENVNAPEP